MPKSNCDYWQQKILGNRKRDRAVTKELKGLGWRVIRFWESFLPDEEADGRTMAELSDPEKDAISHRGRAARAFAQWLGR